MQTLIEEIYFDAFVVERQELVHSVCCLTNHCGNQYVFNIRMQYIVKWIEVNNYTYRNVSDGICARKTGIEPDKLLLDRSLKLKFLLLYE